MRQYEYNSMHDGNDRGWVGDGDVLSLSIGTGNRYP